VYIEDFMGPIPDLDYIEGAIELSVYGVVIIDRSMWDYVDQLWSYIAESISVLDLFS
jgi:hypothetical protein